MKTARPVRPGGRWKRTRHGHLASGLPEPEHADGTSIGLSIRRQAGRGGRRGILCQITDTAPGLAQARAGQLDSERGRGLHIVAALATRSGITTSPDGKTAWFTLTASASPARHTGPELEMEPGA